MRLGEFAGDVVIDDGLEAVANRPCERHEFERHFFFVLAHDFGLVRDIQDIIAQLEFHDIPLAT